MDAGDWLAVQVAPLGEGLGLGVGVGVGVPLGVGVGVGVGVGDSNGVGTGTPGTGIQTAKSGLTEVPVETAVTVGLANVGTVSPPFIIETVPVGET